MQLRSILIALLLSWLGLLALRAEDRPNIVLVMADDQGWGQTGYYNHPILKTPHLDAMAANGLRLDRFYAGGPVCSPTRASVLTGRTHDRTGVYSHGAPLRLQEKTLAQVLQGQGYATGHFGKWHLNGIRGPGVPVLAEDVTGPGAFGFDTWLTVTNFFDLNPIMSRQGKFEEFEGDSSENIVHEALQFMEKHRDGPFLCVIWYGTPHSPWMASPEDRKPFRHLSEREQHHYGELVALDRSVGALRKGLRDLQIAQNTMIWYCSDNGGLSPFGPATVGGLRGWKGTIWEGGLRVPGIIEWPKVIDKGRISGFPAGVVDIFPTVLDILGLDDSVMIRPYDGMSLLSLLTGQSGETRLQPLGFHFQNGAALVDNDYKLVLENGDEGFYQLFNLIRDPAETKNLFYEKPEVAARMAQELVSWRQSVAASIAGKDYPEGRVDPNQPPRIFWWETPVYEPYFQEWLKRPEYGDRLQKFLDDGN